MVSFKIGDIVSADRGLTEASRFLSIKLLLLVNPFPRARSVGIKVSCGCSFFPFRFTAHRGSTWKQGEAEGVIISTGANTFFCRAALLWDQSLAEDSYLNRCFLLGLHRDFRRC